MLQEEIREAEVIVVIQYVETADDTLVGDVALCVAHHLVEERERIAHTTIGLLGYDVQRSLFGLHALLGSHVGQMLHDVVQLDTREVVDLTAREDGGQHLVALRGGEDEDGVAWRLLQCLEEGIERRCRQHVHLVDDEHLVSAYLGRDAHLVDELAYVVHRVVRCSVQLMYIIGTLLVEGTARLTLVASLTLGSEVLAVDRLGEDARTGGLTHAARTAEEVGVCQLPGEDGILERHDERLLPHHRIKRSRTVLSGRNDKVIHLSKDLLIAQN